MRHWLLYEALLLAEALEGQKAERAKFIINKLGNLWNPLPGYSTLEQFVEKIGEIDPSQKGIYMPWIARLALSKPDVNRAEDLNRLGQDLIHFEANKAKITNKDINSYKSFQDLYDTIAPFTQPRKKTADELKKEKVTAELTKLKDEIITVYNSSDGWIRIPKSEAAAKYLGQGTRWCTAATKNCMYSYYAKNDNLFVIYDKTTKQRHQLHIQSGQFADSADKNVGIDAVPEWARKPIVSFYQTNNPQLALKQVLALDKFASSEENVAAGTEHEDLMALMKQYGI